MNNNVKNIVTTVLFSAFIAFFTVLCVMAIFNPNTEKLEGENRLPAQLPTDVTWEQFLNNKTEIDASGNEILSPIKQFENFTVDQFPFRTFFRYIKAHFAMDILGLKENNGYAVENGSIVQITPSFNQGVVDYQIGKLEYTYDKYFKDNGGNHYFALIPDKNYYFGADYGYPMPDYQAMKDQIASGALSEMEYIDLFGSLDLDSYYKTDWHWDQSKLDGVMSTLSSSMGFTVSGKYEQHTKPFSGGYTQQSALYPSNEKLTYLTNEILNGCTVYDYTTGQTYGLYSEEKYNTDTQYDFFLNGMAPFQRIDNPNATSDKKLVVLRDSYGSSLIPLMAEGYSSIYVVDIRYAAPMMIDQLIGADIESADVLFIYSTTILNTHCFSPLP